MSNKNKQNPMPAKAVPELDADSASAAAFTKNHDVAVKAIAELYLDPYVTVDSLKNRYADYLRERVSSLLVKFGKGPELDTEFSDFIKALKPLGSATEVVSRTGLLQYRINTWSTKNFGDQLEKSGPICLQHIAPLLGVAEELAEYAGADSDQGYNNFADALADAAIYLLDYAARTGAFIDITQERYHDAIALSLLSRFGALDTDTSPIKDILVPLGKLIHINLKAVQGIRGYKVGNEKFQADNAKYVNEVFIGLSQACTFTLVPLAEFVFNRVEKRNWVANPEQAHVVASNNAISK